VSAYAKSIVGALAAVLIAGINAWHQVGGGMFRPITLIPVATAVAGAVLTYLVPNVPQLPWAKGAVAGVLGVLTALSTYLEGTPASVSVSSLIVVALGALATWYVPNLPPASAANRHEAPVGQA
jgi:fluoride ion exporter CrcB/FEX